MRIEHLNTQVFEVTGSVEDTIREALKTSVGEINSTTAASDSASAADGSPLEQAQKMIEENKDLLSEENKRLILEKAKERERGSRNVRIPIYNWVHTKIGTPIKKTKPKQDALFFEVPVDRNSREKLGFDKWPIYPLIDSDNLPYYGIYVTSPNIRFMIKRMDNNSKFTCVCYNYKQDANGNKTGTPKERIPEVHGTDPVLNFCARCPSAPHMQTRDMDSSERCRYHRIVIVYIVGQVKDVDTDESDELKKVVVGPLMMELNGVMLNTFREEGPAAKNNFDSVIDYRVYKEDNTQNRGYSKKMVFIGKEDGPKVIESDFDISKAYGEIVNEYGLTFYNIQDEKALAAAKAEQHSLQKAEESEASHIDEPEL